MKWRFAIIPLLVSTISSFGQGSPTDPTITSQPQSQTVPAGADVTLSVTASGTAPLTYQWWDSAGAILDATNADYILNPAQTNNTDNYFVIVGNDYGAITSAVAALVVYLPVSITSQPQNQTACAGSEVTWTVAASGTNLTYQWQRDGTNLVEGADNFTGTTSATL
ncbi:MAG: immunoglobulin domain-containing protein, partial [Verrucomicrobiia bacterium]